MDTVTEKIANYAASTRFDHLTAEAAHAATAAADRFDRLCARSLRLRARANRSEAGKRAGSRQICRTRALLRQSLPAEAATFINTAMIRNFDFNDRYPGGHPSDCLGALLALAGSMQVDGKSLLASMIVVYEIFARLSDATTLSRRGWDQGYAIGIATAAGVCNLLELSADCRASGRHRRDFESAVAGARARASLRRGKMSRRHTPRAMGCLPRCSPPRACAGPDRCVRGPQRALGKSYRPVRVGAVPDRGRRLSDAAGAAQILAGRDQWPARGLGGAGAARKRTRPDELKGDRGLRLQVYLVRDRQRAGEVGPADARDGGSQLAVYFCPSACRRTHSRFFIQRRGRSRSGAAAADAKDQSDSGRCHRSSAAGKSLDSSDCDDARRHPVFRRSGKSSGPSRQSDARPPHRRKIYGVGGTGAGQRSQPHMRWKVGGA